MEGHGSSLAKALATYAMPRQKVRRRGSTAVQVTFVRLAAPTVFVTVKDAAAGCGWARANAFREHFLATDNDAKAMGLTYEVQGCAIVDATAAQWAAQYAATERAQRAPNWRLENLGAYARVQRRRRLMSEQAGAQ